MYQFVEICQKRQVTVDTMSFSVICPIFYLSQITAAVMFVSRRQIIALRKMTTKTKEKVKTATRTQLLYVTHLM